MFGNHLLDFLFEIIEFELKFSQNPNIQENKTSIELWSLSKSPNSKTQLILYRIDSLFLWEFYL